MRLDLSLKPDKIEAQAQKIKFALEQDMNDDPQVQKFE